MNTHKIGLKLCRACMISVNNCQLYPFSQNPDVQGKFQYVFNKTITGQDPLPLCLCISCMNRLNISYDFKRVVETSEQEMWQSLKQIRTNLMLYTGNGGNAMASTVTQSKEFLLPIEPAVPVLAAAVVTSSVANGNATVVPTDGVSVQMAAEHPAKVADTHLSATENVMTEIVMTEINSSATGDLSEATTDSSSTATAADLDTDGGHISVIRLTNADTAAAAASTGFVELFDAGSPKRKSLNPYISLANREIYDNQEVNCLCAMCPTIMFTDRQNLAEHCSTVHGTSLKLYVCEYCPEKQLRSFTGLKRHLSKMHVNPRKFKCLTCAKEFNDRIQVKVHVRRHEHKN